MTDFGDLTARLQKQFKVFEGACARRLYNKWRFAVLEMCLRIAPDWRNLIGGSLHVYTPLDKHLGDIRLAKLDSGLQNLTSIRLHVCFIDEIFDKLAAKRDQVANSCGDVRRIQIYTYSQRYYFGVVRIYLVIWGVKEKRMFTYTSRFSR